MVENRASWSHATEEAKTQASSCKGVSPSPPSFLKLRTLSMLNLLSLKVTLFRVSFASCLPTINLTLDSQAVCQPGKLSPSAYPSHSRSSQQRAHPGGDT